MKSCLLKSLDLDHLTYPLKHWFKTNDCEPSRIHVNLRFFFPEIIAPWWPTTEFSHDNITKSCLAITTTMRCSFTPQTMQRQPFDHANYFVCLLNSSRLIPASLETLRIRDRESSPPFSLVAPVKRWSGGMEAVSTGCLPLGSFQEWTHACICVFVCVWGH